jgi:hypothetical protein
MVSISVCFVMTLLSVFWPGLLLDYSFKLSTIFQVTSEVRVMNLILLVVLQDTGGATGQWIFKPGKSEISDKIGVLSWKVEAKMCSGLCGYENQVRPPWYNGRSLGHMPHVQKLVLRAQASWCQVRSSAYVIPKVCFNNNLFWFYLVHNSPCGLCSYVILSQLSQEATSK